ncbi:hypothetical protein TMEC50S_02423 [Thauera mechernichensis]
MATPRPVTRATPPGRRRSDRPPAAHRTVPDGKALYRRLLVFNDGIVAQANPLASAHPSCTLSSLG